jgi:membrane-associated phospholipid phosphatase
MTTRTELRRAAVTMIVAWVLILAPVLGLGWLITNPLETTVDPWDDSVVRWFASQRTADLDAAADAGTFLGETLVGVVVAAVVAVALSLWRRSLRPAVFFALVLAGVGGFYGLATVLITRARPPVRILDPGLVPNDSFPSGHLGTAVAVYGGTALLIGWLAPRARPWIWLLLLVPAVVALARLYEGAHHPTDELASVLYATAWLAVVGSVLLRAPGRRTVASWTWRRSRPTAWPNREPGQTTRGATSTRS